MQRETRLIVKPFKLHLESAGWIVENIHGNQYQAGLPDLYICHARYSPRWVECKVMIGNTVSLTPAQKIKFPKLASHNVPIFVIAADDLRGEVNYSKRVRLYKKLFDEPNVWFTFNKKQHMLLK